MLDDLYLEYQYTIKWVVERTRKKETSYIKQLNNIIFLIQNKLIKII